MRYGQLLSLILILSSCHFARHPSPYGGFNSRDGSIYYKFTDLGVKRGRISPGKTMEVYINYSRMNDSVFWDSRDLWYPFTILLSYDTIAKSKTYLKILLKCNEGDSVNFIVPKNLIAASGFNPHYFAADSIIKVNIRIVSILDSNQLKNKLKKYAVITKDKEIEEQYELNRYLLLNKVPDSDKIGDIYLIPTIQGNGTAVTSGCGVSISYKGYFLNHKTFDSVPVNDPLDFIIGDSGQVINGLETGIKKMRQGEKAKIIIPSHSAFGEKGSSTGIVPPYKTLIYEVTMLKVKQTLKN
jgi:hypothetical protein